MKKITIIFLFLFFSVSLGSAKIYKWRDKNGTIMFSDSPPENGEVASTVDEPVRSSKNDPSTVYNQNFLRSYRAGSSHDEYVYKEIENAKEYLGLLSQKRDLTVQDIMMADYIRFLFKKSAAMPYLKQSDTIRAESLGRRGDAAKRVLSEREKEIVGKGLEMMIGRWESETYQKLNESEIEVLDEKIQSLWANMCSAMADADIGKTISFFHTSTQLAYRKRFEALSRADLQRIAADLSQPIHFVQDTAGILEYALYIERHGQLYSQIVIFGTENNGQWKIKKF